MKFGQDEKDIKYKIPQHAVYDQTYIKAKVNEFKCD